MCQGNGSAPSLILVVGHTNDPTSSEWVKRQEKELSKLRLFSTSPGSSNGTIRFIKNADFAAIVLGSNITCLRQFLSNCKSRNIEY